MMDPVIWLECGVIALVSLAVLYVVLFAVNRRWARTRLPLEASTPGRRRIAVEQLAPDGSVFTQQAMDSLAGTTTCLLTDGGTTPVIIVTAQLRDEGRRAVIVLEGDAGGIAQFVQDVLPHAQVTLAEP